MSEIAHRFTLILAALLLSAPAARAALPSDEKSIEQEIDDEDDHSTPAPSPNELHSDDGLPLTNVPPPPEMVEPKEPPPPEPQPIQHESSAIYDGTTRATTSGRGEPMFDWSKHQGEQEVEHPFRERGLIRITKDRQYVYKIDETEQKHAASFTAGMFHPGELSNPDAPGEVGSTFDENYQQSDAPAFTITYEWQFWPSAIGKWGLQLGSGAYVAQGNGHFVVQDGGANPNAGLTPREVFTFVVVPLNIGAVYRLQLFHRQMVVPYGLGGGTVFSFAEMRDDNRPPKFGGSLGAYFAAGAALNLTYFDALSRIQLDREYGINAVYLTVEFRQIVAITQRYDFTSSMVNGGFLMEY